MHGAKSVLQSQSQLQPNVYAVYDDGFIVRQMKRSDLSAIVELHAREYPVSCDFDVVFDSMEDKRGFIVGEYEGQPVGFAMVYKWSNDIYYGSGYIVDEKFRNRGFGSRMFEACIMKILCVYLS